MARSLERQVAIDAARAAGHLLQAELRGDRRIAFKGPSTNLVTEMDGRAEELIVSRLGQAFPDDTILAEERGDRRIELGVAYDPNLDQLYVAERGQGATVNDRRLAVSSTATLDESLLTTGFPYNIRETRHTNLREYAAFAVRCRGVRRLGSAVLDLAWLASGRLDGFWALRLGPWDIAAGSLFVEEAGGCVTNLVGGALDLEASAVVASNGRIHDAMLAVLRETRES